MIMVHHIGIFGKITWRGKVTISKYRKEINSYIEEPSGENNGGGGVWHRPHSQDLRQKWFLLKTQERVLVERKEIRVLE